MSFHEFRLQGDYVELNLLLKLVGIASSGGEGKHLVAEGRVAVDGVTELRKTYKVRAGQVVTLDDEEISVLPEVD
jgi:ribosome-associated protein